MAVIPVNIRIGLHVHFSNHVFLHLCTNFSFLHPHPTLIFSKTQFYWAHTSDPTTTCTSSLTYSNLAKAGDQPKGFTEGETKLLPIVFQSMKSTPTVLYLQLSENT